MVRVRVHLVRRRYNLAKSQRRLCVELGSDLPVSLRNLDVDKTLLQHQEAATSACHANKSRAETKKVFQKALQPHRSTYLLHDPKSLGAVTAENNHHLARAEDVTVVAEVHVSATNFEQSVSWYMRNK
jgi:hypothetical protein